MAFVIWYRVSIEEAKPAGGGLLAAVGSLLGIGFPVSISNDVFSGQQIIDSEITLNHVSGPVASTFTLKCKNLPNEVIKQVMQKQEEGAKKDPREPLLVKISLGYFDDGATFKRPEPVMIGALTRVKSKVTDDGVIETTLTGQEITGFKLRMKCVDPPGNSSDQTVEAFFKDLLKETDSPDGKAVELAQGHGLTDPLKSFTPAKGRSALDAMRRLSQGQSEQLAMVIRDHQVFLAKAVGGGDARVTLTDGDDIVSQDDEVDTKELQDECPPPDAPKPKPKGARKTRSLTVLGNAKLLIGENVKLKIGSETEEWRIEAVRHSFSGSGFTSVLSLSQAKAGELASGVGGAEGVVQRFLDVAEASQATPIDVGEVKEYFAGSQSKHLATLNYGQSPTDGTLAASVVTPVNEAQQLFNKPIASPFAFHKTGLVVPVYPKMRALLAHNRGLTNDAVVSGFLWAEKPRLEPPKNEPGDYWLCLPTELSDGLPTGKGVNDLTDAKGQRVVQNKGLKLFVGSSDLPDVGARPTVPGDLDGTLVIEHEKGAKVTFKSDGKLEVASGDVKVTLDGTAKEIALTNGTVTLKLSGAAVDVS